MSVSTGETQLEAAALADQLTTNSAPPSQDTVPIHVIQAMREELKGLKQQNEALNNHFQMMQWQQPQQPQQQAYDPFQGQEPTDSITVEKARQGISALENKFSAQLAELKMTARNPDLKEIINQYLPKAAQEDPDILDEIKRSPNPFKTAYLAAKASTAYREDYMNKFREQSAPKLQPKVDPEAEKIVNNLKQSGNLSSVGNSAKSAPSKHPNFSQMTDDEFRQYKSQIRFGGSKR
jgi:hypothetical protein